MMMLGDVDVRWRFLPSNQLKKKEANLQRRMWKIKREQEETERKKENGHRAKNFDCKKHEIAIYNVESVLY